jgi:hypothetical protein
MRRFAASGHTAAAPLVGHALQPAPKYTGIDYMTSPIASSPCVGGKKLSGAAKNSFMRKTP